MTCLACYLPTLITDQRCLVCGAEGGVAGEPPLVEDVWKEAGRRSRWKGADYCTCAEAESKRAA